MIVHMNWHCSKCFQIILCMVDSSLVCASLNFYVYLIVPVKASVLIFCTCAQQRISTKHMAKLHTKRRVSNGLVHYVFL